MQKRTGTPTIRDVAERAGVSIGTASRVINKKQTVKPAIRAKVLEAIETLRYRPNAVAQSMRRRSTQMVGCIIREINIPTLAAFVHAAHDVLDRAGFSLLLSNSAGLEEREKELLNRLNGQQTDGILFGPYTPIDDDFEDFLHKIDAPIVLVDRDELDWADCVMADHASSAYEATLHLLELGHRSVLLLTGDTSIYPARERIRGYREAFKKMGVPVDEKLICATGFGAMEGFRHTSANLAMESPPTAVFAGGIDMLPGVLRAIRVRGISIPDDISVIAVGDSDLAELYAPPISLIRWDQGEIGQTAAQLLLDRIKDRKSGDQKPEPPQRVLLPTEFVLRSSTAKPKISK